MHAAHQLERDFIGCDLAYDCSKPHLHGEMNKRSRTRTRRGGAATGGAATGGTAAVASASAAPLGYTTSPFRA
jgi:hypothetical protein